VARVITPTLWRCDRDGNRLEELTDALVAGSISMNLDRDAGKVSASFTLTDPDRVRPYVDFLKPELLIEFDDGRPSIEHPLGFYATRTPSAERTIERYSAVFECEDLTRLLGLSAYTATDNVPSARNIVTEIEETVGEANLTLTAFPATTRTTSKDLTFPVGTTRLDKINELLKSIGFYQAYPNRDGRITSREIVALDQLQPVATLTDADVLGPIATQTTDQTLVNVVVVVKDDAADAPLTAIARNDDPASPTSTVSTGFAFTRVERVSELQTQAEVDGYAARLLAEARSYYQTATVNIWPDWPLGIYETVELDLTGELADLNGRWWVRTWDLGLTPADAIYRMELNRVTNYTLGVTL
jgi:hypothetical protein